MLARKKIFSRIEITAENYIARDKKGKMRERKANGEKREKEKKRKRKKNIDRKKTLV